MSSSTNTVRLATRPVNRPVSAFVRGMVDGGALSLTLVTALLIFTGSLSPQMTSTLVVLSAFAAAAAIFVHYDAGAYRSVTTAAEDRVRDRGELLVQKYSR